MDKLPIEERKDILNQEINKYVSRGYRVISQTDTTAQLIKPKHFSLLLGIVFLLLWVLPFILYLLYYLSKRDSAIYLTIDEAGNVIKR